MPAASCASMLSKLLVLTAAPFAISVSPFSFQHLRARIDHEKTSGGEFLDQKQKASNRTVSFADIDHRASFQGLHSHAFPMAMGSIAPSSSDKPLYDNDFKGKHSVPPRNAAHEKRLRDAFWASLQARSETEAQDAKLEDSLLDEKRSATEHRRWVLRDALPACVQTLFEQESRKVNAMLMAHSTKKGTDAASIELPLPVYVVHAPELEVRRMALEPDLQAGNMGLTVWVEGFRENDFLQSPELAECFFSAEVAAAATSQNGTGLLLRRMASTTLKHWFVYWHMISEGFAEALVLEDDARPKQSWISTLAQLKQDELASLQKGLPPSGTVSGDFMPSPLTSLLQVPAIGAQTTPLYDFVSLASCSSASGLSGLHSTPGSEKQYSEHLFLPKEHFTHRCYAAYLISAPGAAKLLLSRLAAGSPGLQKARRPGARVDFTDVSPDDLMGETAWALGANFRVFWCEPVLFEHSQLGGSSHFVAGSLQDSFKAPPEPNARGVVETVKKLHPEAPDFIINIGCGDGKSIDADGHPDPMYHLFKDMGLSGLAVEPDPNYVAMLAHNLPWSHVKKVVGVPVTPLNVARLLEAAGSPIDPLYVKIGLDSYDCAVIHAFLAAGFQPYALHVNVNHEVPPPYAFGVHYDINFRALDGTGGFYGCSLSLVDAIVRPYQYIPVQAGGHHEVVYVRAATFDEVPVTYAWEAIRGGSSRFDQTNGGALWHDISWRSPETVDLAKAALVSSCAATQNVLPSARRETDGKLADPFGLESGCPVRFTFSVDPQDFMLQNLGIAARASFLGIEGGITSLAWAQDSIWSRYLNLVHKDKSQVNARLMLTYGQLVSGTAVKRACQVGFNDGFSALAILLALPPQSDLVTFDAGDQDHTWRMTDFLQKVFPGRFQVIWGNTTDSIPMSAGNLSQPCDVAFVGSSTESPKPEADLANIMLLSRPNTTLVMFNRECLNSSLSSCSKSGRAFSKALIEG